MSARDEPHKTPPAGRRRGLAVVIVMVLGVVGALSAAAFWLALVLEGSGFAAPGDDPRAWVVVGYAAGLVASIAVPVAAAVALLRGRWWWVLLAGAAGIALAVTTFGVS